MSSDEHTEKKRLQKAGLAAMAHLRSQEGNTDKHGVTRSMRADVQYNSALQALLLRRWENAVSGFQARAARLAWHCCSPSVPHTCRQAHPPANLRTCVTGSPVTLQCPRADAGGRVLRGEAAVAALGGPAAVAAHGGELHGPRRRPAA